MLQATRRHQLPTTNRLPPTLLSLPPMIMDILHISLFPLTGHLLPIPRPDGLRPSSNKITPRPSHPRPINHGRHRARRIRSLLFHPYHPLYILRRPWVTVISVLEHTLVHWHPDRLGKHHQAAMMFIEPHLLATGLILLLPKEAPLPAVRARAYYPQLHLC